MSHPEFLSHSIFEILDNAVLAWGLIACGVAQSLKLVFELILHRRWRPAVFFETGGMPSSHSALMTGTASALGLQLGFSDPVFALAATLAFIVMYDASGVRKASGLTAERVNLLPEKLWTRPPEKPLKENLGHTRIEVLVGSLLGPVVALPGMEFIGSPIHLVQKMSLLWG